MSDLASLNNNLDAAASRLKSLLVSRWPYHERVVAVRIGITGDDPHERRLGLSQLLKIVRRGSSGSTRTSTWLPLAAGSADLQDRLNSWSIIVDLHGCAELFEDGGGGGRVAGGPALVPRRRRHG